MHIAHLTLELRMEAAHSLKDKRQVTRSLKDRLRASFNVAVAEVEVTDLWQRATIAIVSVSESRDYLEGLMKNVESAATRIANNCGAEIVDSFFDFVD
jgi:uncharacterized protein YlxP (DUF503 family)